MTRVLFFLHIPALTVAYLLFGGATALGLLFLVQEHRIKQHRAVVFASRWPSLEALEAHIYRLILVGYPLLTLGILLGTHWALQTRHRFWGWDPTETLSLVTWVVYAGYLILRGGMGWRGRKATYLALAGFALVLLSVAALFFFSPLHPLGRAV